MKTTLRPLFLATLLLAAGPAPAAQAAWMWTPQTGWVGSTGAVKDTPEEQLLFGVGFFDQQDYPRAEKEFKKLIAAYKDSREAGEAQYYLGRCAEEAGDYYKAFKAYRKTIQVYPSTKRFDEILEREYQLGNRFLAGQKRKVFGLPALLPARDKAIEIYRAMVEDGPFSEYGQLAQYKLGLAHLALGDYEEAVSAFEQVISRYPDSPLVDDARFQIAQASLKGTFRPGYDQSPTDTAIKELTTFIAEYTESDLVDDASQRLIDLKARRAEHEFLVGQFYERRKRYSSAALYYQGIIDHFSETTWAAHAASRLQVLEHRL